MQELYATTFTLASSSASASPFQLALERIGDWCWERMGEAPDLEAQNGELTNEHGWKLNTSRLVDDEENREALRASLRHPDRETDDIEWRTNLTVSRGAGVTRATTQVARTTLRPVLRPAGFALRPPTIVARLLDRPLAGYAGSIELSAVARKITTRQAPGFVADVLQSEGRLLPVVVLAGEVLRIPPSELARRMVGLCHVAVLDSQNALDAFGDAVPSRQFVPKGGARIYWPGFSSDANLHHRYWPRSRLSSPPFDRQLRRMLAPLSVLRVPSDRVPEQIQVALTLRSIEQLRQAPLEAVGEAEDQLHSLQDRYDHLESEAVDIAEKNRVLEERTAELNSQNAALGERLATAEENVRAAYAWQEGDSETDDEADADDAESTPDSWSTFEERVTDLTGPGFELTDRALDCASQNSYPSPARMWEHLEKLSDAGAAYEASNARVGNRFAEWAHQTFGLDIALTDSTYTNDQFEFQGEQLSRLPHVKIDDGVPPNEVGRIYFALDSDNARLVVDWFGVKRDRP